MVTDSDSASDFGGQSRKRKRKASPIEDIRFTSRGSKLPNYYENEEDITNEDDSMASPGEVAGSTTDVHEIEIVLDHHRDEEKLDDPVDNFHTNMVRYNTLLEILWLVDTAFPHQMERVLSYP